MLKLSASADTLEDALRRVRARAVETLTVDGELLPFSESTPVIATSTDEGARIVVTVTYSVSVPSFGVRVEQGQVTAVDLAGVDLASVVVAGERLSDAVTRLDQPVKNIPVEPVVKDRL